MARTMSLGDMEGGGPGGQILFNGLRVRMAISTGTYVSSMTGAAQAAAEVQHGRRAIQVLQLLMQQHLG